MKILVTGAAGFIGYYLCKHLLARGDSVVGIDNLNDYYDVSLKNDRITQLQGNDQFVFKKLDLADNAGMYALFNEYPFERVFHMGAQAGVRYSIDNPRAYADSNLHGFINILEGCRASQTPHLIYASSSSVYGANTLQPFSETHNVDHPVSLYAASKKSNELMAHCYSNLFALPTTGLRFFTVYGPWGRPDMAYFKFTKAICEGKPIDVYNHGDMYRDFTYIDDIVEGIIRVSDKIPSGDTQWSGDAPNPSSSFAPYRVFNIGNNKPVKLMDFIATIESCLNKKAVLNMLPMQPGDVQSTYADISALHQQTGFTPRTGIEHGIAQFVDWYKNYYKI
ncbi:UDP-glucose 4-epimerase [Thalassocella blandensis]|nr:UDP-glucose 4-epimerase [Thalassocella blandensis]